MAGRKKSLSNLRKQCKTNYEFVSLESHYGAPASFIGKALLHKHELGLSNAHKRIGAAQSYTYDTRQIVYENRSITKKLEQEIADLKNLVVAMSLMTLGLMIVNIVNFLN